MLELDAVQTLAFAGLAYSLFPYLVVDRMTLWQAAAAPESLLIMLTRVHHKSRCQLLQIRHRNEDTISPCGVLSGSSQLTVKNELTIVDGDSHLLSNTLNRIWNAA